MVRIIIRGDNRYIHRMYAHLRKEHPSTRKSMRLTNSKIKKVIERREKNDSRKRYFEMEKSYGYR